MRTGDFCQVSDSGGREMQMMRKLYQQMVMEKNQITGEKLVQIGGIKREKKDKTETAKA